MTEQTEQIRFYQTKGKAFMLQDLFCEGPTDDEYYTQARTMLRLKHELNEARKD